MRIFISPMQIFLKQITKDFLHKAELNLSSSFLQTLTPPYLSQKKIKNLILKEYFHLSESELQTTNQHHQRKSDFFSASYSGDWLLLGISKEKIGVDLEIIKPRDESLLNAYKAELGTHF